MLSPRGLKIVLKSVLEQWAFFNFLVDGLVGGGGWRDGMQAGRMESCSQVRVA